MLFVKGYPNFMDLTLCTTTTVENQQHMCILFDTAGGKKDVYVLFCPLILAIRYNSYKKTINMPCDPPPYNSTQASPERDVFAAICTHRRR